MSNFYRILASCFCRMGRSRAAGALLLLLSLEAVSHAQTQMNVTDYGAVGNATSFFVNTVNNSAIVTTTNLLSSADIGKTIELFGAGPLGTSTTNQDLVAYIANVVNSTNIYLDRPCGATVNGCYGVYGTNNAGAFQACINAAPSNSVINIPDGTYLIIGASNFVSFNANLFTTYPSIVISKGGLTLLGQSRANTILLGCGAWQNKGAYAYRGYMFECQGPVTNNGPLIFDTLTMDGGVQQGDTGTYGWPASTANGDGWDVTHDAVIDVGYPPIHLNKIFRNCSIRNWRGEQLKGAVPWSGGFVLVTNCSISDGDATALNLPTSHNWVNCTFSNLYEVEEFYEGYTTNSSFFQGCMVTNVAALMALNGALTNSVNPSYTIQSNVFYMNNGGNGVQTTPAENLLISQNTFFGGISGGIAITLGTAGYQGSAINSNIVVTCNTFSNIFYVLDVEGVGGNEVADVLITSNTAIGGQFFATGYGWNTNVLFYGNTFSSAGAYGGLYSATLRGQWYLDDTSNKFPPCKDLGTTGGTNAITYAWGRNHFLYGATNALWVLDDAHPQQMPTGNDMLQVTYVNGPSPAPLYVSANMTGAPIMMTNGYSATFQWQNGSWVSPSVTPPTPPIPPVPPLQPPTFLQAVAPGSM